MVFFYFYVGTILFVASLHAPASAVHQIPSKFSHMVFGVFVIFMQILNKHI